ncbi:hypothetical protein ABT282_08615 [Streptomyces sp. NPDC000927]|uniref:hypothetical protein n=1 Tax=Streptomyces sp. NPDC000927 TaxID=3154371 RepID=UPI00331D5539
MCSSCGKGPCIPIAPGPHVSRTTDVHGIPDTSKLETKPGAQAKAKQAADKALIQAKQYADSLLKGGGDGGGGKTWETPEGAQKKVDAHASKTKDVHGIPDTSRLLTEDEVGPLVDAAVADAISKIPGGGDGDGKTWETPEGAQTKVDAHAEKTTDVHGIKDTADLVTKDDLKEAIDAIPTGGGGDGGGKTWETPEAAQAKADKALSDAKAYTDEHAKKTTDIHGIPDTSKLITEDQLNDAISKIPSGGGDGGGKTWETPEAAQAKADKALADSKAYTDEHAAKTTDVHGIADTAQLVTKPELKAVEDKIGQGGGDGKVWETPEGAQAKVDAHAEKTKDVHGIKDTTLLVTKDELKAVEDKIPAGGGDGKTWETPEAAQAKADKALADANKYTDDALKKHVDTYHALEIVTTGGVTAEAGWTVAAQEMRSIGGVHTVFIELERAGANIAGRTAAQKAGDGLPEAGNVVPDLLIAKVSPDWAPPKRLMIDTHSGYTSGSVRVTNKGEIFLADLLPDNALRTKHHLVFSYEFITPVAPGAIKAVSATGKAVEYLTKDETQRLIDKAVQEALSAHLADCHAAKPKPAVAETPAAKHVTPAPGTRSVKVDLTVDKGSD